MKTEFPKIIKLDAKINIKLSSIKNSKVVENIEFVLDIDNYGDVIGIEIINLKYNTHCKDVALNGYRNTDDGIRISYDSNADALSVSFSNNHSLDQKLTDGIVILDDNDYVVGMEINL